MTRAAVTAWFLLLASTAGVALSQPPAALPNGRGQAQPAGGDLLDTDIDALLRRWHAKTAKVKHLYAEFTRTTRDRAFGSVQTNKGSARYRHPNLARLDIMKDASGKGAENLILTEQTRQAGKRMEIWHYKVISADAKDAAADQQGTGRITVRYYSNPRQERDLAEEGPLKLIFGLEPAEAHARYSFKIEGKDQEATHVKVIPKRQADLEDYTEAELWLRHDSSLPKHLRLKSKSEVIDYEFGRRIVTDVDNRELVIDVRDFEPAMPGKDKRMPGSNVIWNLVVQPMDEQPANNPNAGRVRPANAQMPEGKRNAP